MESFELSAVLEGHDDDVRGVTFPDPRFIISASRDATVRTWKLLSTNPPKFDATITSHGSAFINALTYIPPDTRFPDGLIISGGKDAIIEVRQPSKSPEENAEAILLGHSGNVCALDVDPTGQWIVSGGWDSQGRVWKVGNWECTAVLEGHQGSVWAVLAWSPDMIITGCADKLIRIFEKQGKLIRTIRGNIDIIRALCRVPKNHPSGAHFASAGNDGLIRLWNLDGRQLGDLRGHDSFIYSLASLPSGELISSGEDRTVRIWQGDSCIQTITHPAISVWCVTACTANGDIVSGASDRTVRVFSRSKERQANAAMIQALKESVKSSSIPQQQMGDINKEKLPGPEFLVQKSGTKEGQIVMIREADGSITAHQWSSAAQQWVSVGTVVDAVGSSGRKQEYLGQDYDYVFDVDIKDGAPPLKLPYNLAQNPYEAATKFLQDNELPLTYLDSVANFITTNTQGATIGQTQEPQPAGSDPYGIESRYRPGDSSSASQPPPLSSAPPKILPQTTYLSIKQANLKTIQKKIEELNQKLIFNGNKDLSLNPSDLNTLQSLTAYLEHPPSEPSKPPTAAIKRGVELVVKVATTWPPVQRLPGLDLLRLLAAGTNALATYKTAQGGNIVDALERSGVFEDKERSNNVMLATRTFVNLFETPEGRTLLDAELDKINRLTSSIFNTHPSNRNLQISYTTLLINYSVLLTTTTSSEVLSCDRTINLFTPLSTILDPINTTTDSEVIYRALVATGTLLEGGGDEIKTAARDVFGLAEKVAAIKRGEIFREPRIKNVCGEIETLLKL